MTLNESAFMDYHESLIHTHAPHTGNGNNNEYILNNDIFIGLSFRLCQELIDANTHKKEDAEHGKGLLKMTVSIQLKVEARDQPAYRAPLSSFT